jgi:hypothetical protein
MDGSAPAGGDAGTEVVLDAVEDASQVAIEALGIAVVAPAAPGGHQAWPPEHAVLASTIYCALLLVAAAPPALRRLRTRTAD